MDLQLRAAWRQYQSSQAINDYFHYLDACIRAGVEAECILDSQQLGVVSLGGSPCPHCMMKTKLYDDVGLRKLIGIFWEKFIFSPTRSFVAVQQGSDPVAWWAALVLLATYFDPLGYETYSDNFRMSRTLVMNELCYGAGDDYGFDENWPSETWLDGKSSDDVADVASRHFSLLRMKNLIIALYDETQAEQIEIELVPAGNTSIEEDLGPINTNIRPFLRITFQVDKERTPTFEHETLFLFPTAGMLHEILSSHGEERQRLVAYLEKYTVSGV